MTIGHKKIQKMKVQSCMNALVNSACALNELKKAKYENVLTWSSFFPHEENLKLSFTASTFMEIKNNFFTQDNRNS